MKNSLFTQGFSIVNRFTVKIDIKSKLHQKGFSAAYIVVYRIGLL